MCGLLLNYHAVGSGDPLGSYGARFENKTHRTRPSRIQRRAGCRCRFCAGCRSRLAAPAAAAAGASRAAGCVVRGAAAGDGQAGGLHVAAALALGDSLPHCPAAARSAAKLSRHAEQSSRRRRSGLLWRLAGTRRNVFAHSRGACRVHGPQTPRRRDDVRHVRECGCLMRGL